MSGYIIGTEKRRAVRKAQIKSNRKALEEATGAMFKEMSIKVQEIPYLFTTWSPWQKKDPAQYRLELFLIAASPFGSAYRFQKFTDKFSEICEIERRSLERAFERDGLERIFWSTAKALVALEWEHLQRAPKMPSVQLWSVDSTYDEVHFKVDPGMMPWWVIFTKKMGSGRPCFATQAVSVVGTGKPRTLAVVNGQNSEVSAGVHALDLVRRLLPREYPQVCVLADSAYWAARWINYMDRHGLMYIIDVNVGANKTFKAVMDSPRAGHLEEGQGFRVDVPRTARSGRRIRDEKGRYRLVNQKVRAGNPDREACAWIYCVRYNGVIHLLATNLPSYHRWRPRTIYNWYASRFNCEQTYRGMREWKLATRSSSGPIRYGHRCAQMFFYTLFEHLQMKYMPDQDLLWNGFVWTVVDRRFTILYNWERLLYDAGVTRGMKRMQEFLKFIEPWLRIFFKILSSFSKDCSPQ